MTAERWSNAPRCGTERCSLLITFINTEHFTHPNCISFSNMMNGSLDIQRLYRLRILALVRCNELSSRSAWVKENKGSGFLFKCYYFCVSSLRLWVCESDCVWIFDYFIPRWWCFFFATQRPSSFSSNEERQGPQWEEPGLQKWRPSLAQSIWRGHLLRARWKRETTTASWVCEAQMQHLKERSTIKMLSIREASTLKLPLL